MDILTSRKQLSLPLWLVRGGVIVALLLYCVAIGAVLARGSMRFSLLLLVPPVLGLGAVLVSRYYQTFVLALPVFALILPAIELPTGTETRLPLSLLLAIVLTGVWCLSLLIRGGRLVPSPLNRPLLVFGAVCVLSLGWSLVWRDFGLITAQTFIITQLGALVTILVSLSASLMIGNVADTPGKMRYIVGCFLLFGTLMTLVQFFHVGTGLLNDRGLWGTWLVACAYGLLVAQPGLRWYWRLALLAIVALNLYQTMIVNSLWVSGWLPSLIAIIVITFLRSSKVFLIIAVVALISIPIYQSFFTDVTQANIDEGGLERLIIYQQSWRILRDHLLLGTGPAGYSIYYMSYFPEEARSTHNNYLDIAAQFGIVGSLAWLWLAAVSVWECWRLVRVVTDGFLRTVVIIVTGGWVAAMVAMVLGDWVLPFAYNQGIAGYKYTVYTWIFLGLLISVRQLVASGEQGSEPMRLSV